MIRLILISFFLVTTCGTQMTSRKVIKNHTELLFGDISKQQLYFDYPVWQEQENIYMPDKEVKDGILSYDENINVHVFLGTWCGDSRRNVPRFFKSIKGNDHYKVFIWAVDRKMKLDNNLPERYDIHRVPTFVFEKNGIEVGRIVENPNKSIEEDILDILQPNK